MGIFIQVSVDASRLTSQEARALVSSCPVDIFSLDGEELVVRTDNEDECTLCELCLHAMPRGALTIRKTYKDECLVSTGDGR